MKERRTKRTNYINLYTLTLKGAKLSEEKTKALSELEEVLSYEDLLLFASSLLVKIFSSKLLLKKRYRSLARAYVKKSGERVKKEEKKGGEGGGGMVGWMWSAASSWTSSAPKEVKEEQGEEEGINPLLMKELYETIEYSESEAAKKLDLPKDYVNVKVSFHLQTGSIELKTENEEEKKKKNKFVSLAKALFKDFEFGVLMRQDSHFVESSLQSCVVSDSNTIPSKELLILSPEQSESKTLWNLELEINPLDSPGVDYKVKMASRPVNLLFSKPTVLELINFFEENKASTSYKGLQSYARDSVEAVKKQTKMQLLNALQKKKVFDINIDSHAPIIWIPEDFYSPQFTIMVVSLGRIIVKNEHTPQITEKQLQENLSVDDFYEKFLLMTKEFTIKMLHVDTLKEDWSWGSVNYTLLFPKLMEFVEPFDLHLALEHCLIDSNELPTFRISANLPLVKTNFSTVEFSKFIQIARMIVWEEKDVLPNLDDLVVSFPAEEIVNIDQESVDSQFNQLYKKNIQVRFSVDKLELRLRHQQTKKDIVLTLLSKFNVVFTLRTKDWNAVVSLKEMTIEDLIQTYGPQFKYLAMSKQSGEDDLITINYTFVSSFSPHYQQVDHAVDWRISSLHYMFNRETFVALIHFGNDLLERIGNKRIFSQTKPNQQLSDIVAQSTIKEKRETGENVFLRLTFHLDNLQVTLNKKGKPIAEISLSKTTPTLFVRRNDTIKMTLKLGDIKLMDLRPVCKNWKQVLTLKEPNDTLNFVYETYNEVTRPQGKFYNTYLYVCMQSMRFVYTVDFVSDFFSYFTEIAEMYDMLVSSYTFASEVTAAKGEASLWRYEFNFANPLAIVPKSFDSQQVILADLGNITFSTSFFKTQTKEQLLIVEDTYSMKKMNLKSGVIPFSEMLSQQEDSSSLLQFGIPTPTNLLTIIQDTDVEMVKQMPYDESYLGPAFPKVVWSGEISKINVKLTEEQAQLLFSTIKENLTWLSFYGEEDEIEEERNKLGKAEEEKKVSEESSKELTASSPPFSNFSEEDSEICELISNSPTQNFGSSLHNPANLGAPRSQSSLGSALFSRSSSTSNPPLPNKPRANSLITPTKPKNDSSPKQSPNRSQTPIESILLEIPTLKTATSSTASDLKAKGECEEEENFKVKRFQFKLEKISFELLKGSGRNEENQETSFVLFEFDKLGMDANEDNTGYNLSCYQFESLTIRDKRFQVKNKFEEILAPKGEVLQQLTLKQVTHQNKDTEFVMSLDHPRIILLPDAIYELWGFVWPLSQQALQSWTLYSNFEASKVKRERLHNKLNKLEAPFPQELVESVEVEREPDFEFKVTISNPEICLVEDATNINSRSIVLKTTLLYKQNNKPAGGFSYVIHARQMEAYKCLLKEVDTSIAIIAPFDWTLRYVFDPTQQFEETSLSLEPIAINYSYLDFKLTMALAKSWLYSPTKVEEEKKEIEEDKKEEKADLKDERDSLEMHSKGKEESFSLVKKNKEKTRLMVTSSPIPIKVKASPNSPLPNKSDKNGSEELCSPPERKEIKLSTSLESKFSSPAQTNFSSLGSGNTIQMEEKQGPKENLNSSPRGTNKSSTPVGTPSGTPLGSPRTESKTEEGKEEKSEESEKEMVEFAGVGEEKETSEKGEEKEVSEKGELGNSEPKRQIYKLQTAEMEIKLIDDSNELNLPVAVFNFRSLNLYFATNSLSKMKVSSEACFNIDIFNSELQVWEPLLEMWAVQASLSRDNLLNTFKLTVNSEQLLELTLSKSSLKTLMSTYENCSKDYYEMDKKGVREFRYPYYVSNQLGIPIWFWTVSEEMGSNDPKPLEANKTEPLKSGLLLQGSRRFMKYEQKLSTTLSFKLPGDFLAVKDVSIDRRGKQFVTIDPNHELKLVCESSNFHGSKVITIRTGITLTNNTDIDIKVIAQTLENVLEELPLLQKGESYHLPLQHLRSKLRFAPSMGSKDYLWSKEGLPCSNLSTATYLISCSPDTGHGYPLLFYCTVDETRRREEEERHPHEHNISFYSPYQLENLLACQLEFRILAAENKKVIESGKLEKGQKASLMIDIRKPLCLTVKMPQFSWSQLKTITGSTVERGIQLVDAKGNGLDLHLRIKQSLNGIVELSLFSDFWIINETGLPLLYSQQRLSNTFEAAGQLQMLQEIEDLEGKENNYYVPKAEERSTPFLFSYLRNVVGRAKFSVRSANTQWSKAVSLKSRRDITIECYQIKGGKQVFTLGLNVERANGKFWRTYKVTIYPRYVLINNTLEPLSYHQYNSAVDYQLLPDEQRPFYWQDREQPKQLCVCFTEGTWNFSSPFSIDQIDSKFAIKMRSLTGETSLLKVQTSLKNGVVLVIFNYESEKFPSYRIFNKSSYPIRMRQLGVKLTSNMEHQVLEAGNSIPYAWDKPQSVPRYLYVEVLREKDTFEDEEMPPNLIVDLQKIGEVFEDENTNRKKLLFGSVFADGPTMTLEIRDAWSEEDQSSKTENVSELLSTHLKLDLVGIGISIVDQQTRFPEELAYVSVSNISTEYISTNLHNTLLFTVQRLQVDNQRHSPYFPVLLYFPSEENPSLSFGLIQSNQHQNVVFIKKMELDIEEMEIKLDDELLLRLFVTFSAFIEESTEEIRSSESTTFHVPPTDLKATILYFEDLLVNRVKASVTFLNTKYSDECPEETTLGSLLQTIGAVANFENAPITFEKLNKTTFLTTSAEISSQLSTHYYENAIGAMSKLVSYSSVIGNPGALLDNISEGAKDFVSGIKPDEEEKKKAGGGLKAFGNGAKSFFKKTVYGIFNTSSKITSSIGDGVSRLAMDENYEKTRKQLSRKPPKHAVQGIAYGARDLGIGLFKGVTGVVSEPVSGSRSEGVAGFFKGLSRGVTGLYVKPGVGVIDFISRMTEGVKNTTTLFEDDKKRRQRKPRHFGPDGSLESYSESKASAQQLLYSLSNNKYLENREKYIRHILLTNQIILITDRTVIFVKSKNAKALTEEWVVPISKIKSVEYDMKEKEIVNLHVDKLSISEKKRLSAVKIIRINCIYEQKNIAQQVLKIFKKLVNEMLN